MAVISVWAGVAVAVQSALAAPVNITAISKANPAVASTATTPTAGDFVLLKTQGMHQVNSRVFRVGTVVPSTSFQLEGEDSTNYDTFTSGTYETITFGTTVTTVTGVNVSGGEFRKEETTTIHDLQASQIPTVAEPQTFAMESIWDASDAALKALVQASKLKQTRAVRITFANGQKYLFNGYVGATLAPGGTAQGKVITPLSFDQQAIGTFYAT